MLDKKLSKLDYISFYSFHFKKP